MDLPLLNHRYLLLDKIGQGGFGVISQVLDYHLWNTRVQEKQKAGERMDKEAQLLLALEYMWAVKKQTCQREYGVNFTTLREIKVAKSVESELVVGVEEIFVENESVSMVMPLCLTDLAELLATHRHDLPTCDKLFLFR